MKKTRKRAKGNLQCLLLLNPCVWRWGHQRENGCKRSHCTQSRLQNVLWTPWFHNGSHLGHRSKKRTHEPRIQPNTVKSYHHLRKPMEQCKQLWHTSNYIVNKIVAFINVPMQWDNKLCFGDPIKIEKILKHGTMIHDDISIQHYNASSCDAIKHLFLMLENAIKNEYVTMAITLKIMPDQN